MARTKQDIITFKVDSALSSALQGVGNRSEFIRAAILDALDNTCPLCKGSGALSPKQKEHWARFSEDHSVEQPTHVGHTQQHPDDREGAAWWGFSATGFAAGTAALTVGAVGPLIAPVFARRDFVKERLIATKAVCQLTTHVMKIPAFLLIRDLDVPRLGGLALVMICMVIPGTLIGKRLLTHVSERHFIIAYRVALTFAGLKVLIFDGLRYLPIWP